MEATSLLTRSWPCRPHLRDAPRCCTYQFPFPLGARQLARIQLQAHSGLQCTIRQDFAAAADGYLAIAAGESSPRQLLGQRSATSGSSEPVTTGLAAAQSPALQTGEYLGPRPVSPDEGSFPCEAGLHVIAGDSRGCTVFALWPLRAWEQQKRGGMRGGEWWWSAFKVSSGRFLASMSVLCCTLRIVG